MEKQGFYFKVYSEKEFDIDYMLLIVIHKRLVTHKDSKIEWKFQNCEAWVSIAKSKRSKLAWEMFSALSFQEDVFVTNYLVGIVI